MKIDVEKLVKTAEIIESVGTVVVRTTKVVEGIKDFKNNIHDHDAKTARDEYRQQKNIMKKECEKNNEICNIIYNELKERFYKNQEINEIVDKCKFDKNDLLLTTLGLVTMIGPVIVGCKAIKVITDKNIDVDVYYNKIIEIIDECGLKEKIKKDVNYVPNDEELMKLMKRYKNKTSVELIEILHCKHGHLNIKYKNK